MNLSQIVNQARAVAARFAEAGREEMRLPVFAFEDWRIVYGRPSGGAAVTEYRAQQKQNWYMAHFLRQQGVKVTPVTVRAQAFLEWAEAGDHDLTDGHGRAHAVGDYVHDPATPLPNCAHSYPDMVTVPGQANATITVYGDDPEQPEVMTAALHLPDGQVLTALEVLAVEHTPQEAWDQVSKFLERHQPGKVFHDQTVRRPEYCIDCGALQLSVASPQEGRA